MLDHRKKQRNSRKIPISVSSTMPKPLTVWKTTNCGKFLKRWEYHTLPAFWVTCMQVKKQQKQTWNNGLVPNGERSTSRLYTVILLRYIEYIIWNARLDDSHTKMNITWRNINSLRYADDTTLTAEKEKELKGGRGEWKSWLKTQHSKN